MSHATRRPRWLVPEVVQTSAMDCGPAALKALLEGFRISASYGRLREACQTDVDGTSINALEEAAVQLGLEAEQIIIPFDHLLLDEADALPAIVTLWSPGKLIHFVVAWRRFGSVVQVMDPSTGRRWPSLRRFREQLYVHEMTLDATQWFEWAASDDFTKPLTRRLRVLGIPDVEASRLIQVSLERPGWRPLAGLDAAVRMASDLMAGGGLSRPTAKRVVQTLVERAGDDPQMFEHVIPSHYWSARPLAGDTDGTCVHVRGAVIVHVRGPRGVEQLAGDDPSRQTTSVSSVELAAALTEPPSRPGRDLLHLLRTSGPAGSVSMLGAAAVAAGAVLCEALLFRALIDWGGEFLRPGQRAGMIGAVAGFLAALLLLEWSLTAGLLRAGRRFEMQLRLAILQKIPRLGDRYFHSRLVSDMAERSHSIHSVRTLPLLGSRFVQALVELVLTVAAISWIAPDGGWIAAPVAVVVVALPFIIQPLLSERDLRFRAHAGALTRVVLDASLGLLPIRAHSAERAVRRQHESLLTDWGRAGLGLHDIERRVSTLQNVVGFGGAIGIVWLQSTQSTGVVPLLLAFWALRLPLLGQELTMVLRQYPARRNVMLRLLEPLGAPSEALAGVAAPASDPNLADGSGVALDLNNVSVRVAGHEILHEVNLSIPRGAHVAIVGASGSGKSTLVGLFLGWAGTLTGRVHLDGSPLDAVRVMQLRGQTAWIDPAVQLWNRSLLENLIYGTADDRELAVMQAADEGGLHEVVERLPDGLRTRLGEGGGLLSGGEGQRVRYARSLLRSDTRLAILDEPFRGLDRDTRRQLLAGARRRWKNATMLCVTHDVAETLAFGRVLVVHDGRIVEDGDPRVLASQPGSHYASMLATEKAVHDDFWGAPHWRRLWLDRGTLNTQS